jgi:hypothetical protein
MNDEVNVYLVCSEFDNNKLYKIGYTKRNIDKRISEFKTGNCSELYLVNSFKSKWGTKIESILHKKYKSQSKNINGEWFKLENEDIINFYNDCKKIHDNIETISNENSYFKEKNKF